MPTTLRAASYMNHWCPATPVRVDVGPWIAYFTVDAAAARIAEGRREDFILARGQLKAGQPLKRPNGITYQLVTGPDESA